VAATRNRKTSTLAPELGAAAASSGAAGKTSSAGKASSAGAGKTSSAGRAGARAEAEAPREPTQTVRPSRAGRKKDEPRAAASPAMRHLRPIGLLLALLVSVYTLVALATWNPLDPPASVAPAAAR